MIDAVTHLFLPVVHARGPVIEEGAPVVVSAVPNTSWFALAVRRRRIDLGVRKRDMPTRGGPSTPTMYKIKSGGGSLTATVLARLEHALDWTPGAAAHALAPTISSMQEVLDAVGYDPTPPTTDIGEPLRHQLPPPTTAFRARDWTDDPQDLTPSGRRQQPRAHRTRSLLIAAAAHEITNHGYTTASVDSILDLAGASKGAMYFHFSCKAELADAVITAAEHLYTTITERWLNAQSAHPLDAIACLIDDIANTYTTRHILQAETALLYEPRFQGRRPSRIWERAITDLAHTAADTGSLRTQFTPSRLADALTAAITGHCHARRTLAAITAAAPDTTTGDDAGKAPGSRLTESVDIIYAAMAAPQYLTPTHTR